MKTKIKFGEYKIHPKDVEETIVEFPDDTIFFTGGDNDIGDGKYEGAYHILAITKSKELEYTSYNPRLVMYSTNDYKYEIFRANGYAFIYISNCIPIEGIEFTNIDKVNELLDLVNHPVYTVLFNDKLALCNVTRIDRIDSYWQVKYKSIQLYSQIGSYYYPIIYTNITSDLCKVLTHYHEFYQYIPDEKYGKELFDEVMYTALKDIYPEFESRLIGYDLDYLHRTGLYFNEISEILNKNFYNRNINEDEAKRQIANNLEEFYKLHPKIDLTDFDEIRTFKKKLPIS